MKQEKVKGSLSTKTPRDVLTHYMAERGGMRNTSERYAILDVVMQMKGHHDADRILAMMPENFHVSRSTMYNTLALFVKCGLLCDHQLKGTTLYERAHGRAPHHHCVCTVCDKIWDMHDNSIDETIGQIKTPRFKKLWCRTYVYGVCSSCQAKLLRARKKIEKKKAESLAGEELRFARINEELAKMAEWFL